MNAAAQCRIETSSGEDAVISVEADVATAARLLRDRGVRHLIVKDLRSLSKEGIAGILDGHDIAVTVVACERDPRSVTVADVMQVSTAGKAID